MLLRSSVRSPKARPVTRSVTSTSSPSSVTPSPMLPSARPPDNLKSAIAGETYEYTEMYPGFAKTARDEGFEEIAEWLETLARAEKSHAGRFTEGLESVS